jgi:hypothetical protein
MHNSTMDSVYLVRRATTIMRYANTSTMSCYRVYTTVNIVVYRCTTISESRSGTRRETICGIR